MNIVQKAREGMGWVFIVVLLIYAFTVSYWLLYPYEPIVVEAPMKILNDGKKVKAGGVVFYRINYEKKMDITGELTRKLVNSYKMDLRDSKATAPVGKDTDAVPIEIPSFAEPGTYYIWWSASYRVNPLRTVTVSVPSENFEVVK